MRGVIESVGFLLLILSSSSSQTVVESVHGTEGQVSWLECEVEENNFTVVWTRDNQTVDTSTPRIIVQGAMLWFLPAKEEDSGLYTCSESPLSPVVSKMRLSVGREPCPLPSEIRTLQQGTNETLICRQDEVSQIASDRHDSWLRDCKPIDSLTLVNVMPSDAGNYTCVVHFTYEGKSYLASRTVLLNVQNAPPVKPTVIYPLKDTVYVFPDQPANLTCIAFLGDNEESVLETISYWTVNHTFIQKCPGLSKHVTKERKEDGMYYSVNTLSIPEVQQQYFHLPFQCKFVNSMGEDYKDLRLKPLNHHVLYSCTGSLVVLVLVLAALLCCISRGHWCRTRVIRDDAYPLLSQTSTSTEGNGSILLTR
ncbi:interleukin-1 receptor type 1-like isoform X2 [Clupea harengus]|uniref:Interleukin-1 receptor type 1-like isoform X2 n=1 Tax=Clupea harengus TaxID=7950 RepID=A0A6P8ER30_CLUHA|nr:interleukin-1 receptor type 1-like isoform X2 [Clupea harengus]